MKRMLIILVCINLIVSLFPTSVNAETPTNSESVAITYFEDGSYCITTITVVQHILDRATITGTKTNQYYDSNDVAQFSVSVKGTFTYDGTTATATTAYYSYQVFNSFWPFVSGNASCSGNTATASCTFALLGVLNRTLSVSLTCSPTGVLS